MFIRRTLAALFLALAPTLAHAERVRDLGAFQGVRSNQLTGYGVVVGLDGTGDDNLEYLTQASRDCRGGSAFSFRRAASRGSRMPRRC